ncbi:MAG TPA: hypothetical protein VGF48_08545 [Thermoanaerobaculia bacterium]|jgi:hypothetical protein
MRLDEVDSGEGDGLSSPDPKKNRPPDQPRSDRRRDLTTLLNRDLNVWDPAPPPSDLADKDIQHEIVWFDRALAQIAPGRTAPLHLRRPPRHPILQTNSSRAVTWRVEYEPFGSVYEVRAGTRTEQATALPGAGGRIDL